MKIIKTSLLVMLFLCFTINATQAQQAFQVHQDNVKPSMIMEYEKIAKEFNEASVANNVQATWFTATTNDFKYFYITPIENFADLDKRPFADMANTMGDKWKALFQRFDKCYDSHGSYILIKDDSLSYMPEGITNAPEDENYRDWFYMYYTPENAEKIKEGIKAVKDFYISKGSKQYYRIYKNGFGSMENFYLVSIASKDEIDSAQKSKTNKEVLGPDRWDTFSKVMNYTTRVEEYTGEMRPDLSYSPKTD